MRRIRKIPLPYVHMAISLDRVEELWPDRKIFQGAATAYLRYDQTHPEKWILLEQPLWRHVLSFFDKRTRMLDFGAGAGKLTTEAVGANIDATKIVAFEPNDILASAYREKHPLSKCYRKGRATIADSSWVKNGFTLIAANMVVNHLDENMFEKFVKGSSRALNSHGTLIYTIPHPLRKAFKYGWATDASGIEIDEEAPWGGDTRYYHRSVGNQVHTLVKNGFHVSLIEWDKDDAVGNGYRNGPNLEPRRLMICARKGRKVSESMIHPESFRVGEDYPLQEKFGESIYGFYNFMRDSHVEKQMNQNYTFGYP